ncbi:MAG: hypothetical protein ACW99Q_09930, partial [Candidatus Kariarchaeaceae archaeon]
NIDSDIIPDYRRDTLIIAISGIIASLIMVLLRIIGIRYFQIDLVADHIVLNELKDELINSGVDENIIGIRYSESDEPKLRGDSVYFEYFDSSLSNTQRLLDPLFQIIASDVHVIFLVRVGSIFRKITQMKIFGSNMYGFHLRQYENEISDIYCNNNNKLINHKEIFNQFLDVLRIEEIRIKRSFLMIKLEIGEDFSSTIAINFLLEFIKFGHRIDNESN